MQRSIRRENLERAADVSLELHREAGEILPAELRRGQCLPHFFGRGGDIDRVDDRGPEPVDIDHGRCSMRAVTGNQMAPCRASVFCCEQYEC
jgi:hypothetical protein